MADISAITCIKLEIPNDVSAFVCPNIADDTWVLLTIPGTCENLEEFTLPCCKNISISGHVTSGKANCLLPNLKRLVIPSGVIRVLLSGTVCNSIEEVVMEGPGCVIDEHSNFGKMAITMPLSDASFDAIIGKRLPYTRRKNNYYSSIQFLIMPEHDVEYYVNLCVAILEKEEEYNPKSNYNYLSNVATTLVFDSADDLINKICDGTFDKIIECVSLFTKHSRGNYPISTQLEFSGNGSKNDGVFAILSEIYKNCGSSIPVFRIALKLGLADATNLNLEVKLAELLEKTRASRFADAVKAICILLPEDNELHIPLCKEDYPLDIVSKWREIVTSMPSDIGFSYDMFQIYFLLECWLCKLLGASYDLGEENSIVFALKKDYSRLKLLSPEMIDDVPFHILMDILDIFYEIIINNYSVFLKSVSVYRASKRAYLK